MVKIRGQLAQATQQLDTLKRTSAEEKALLRRSLEQEFETKWKRQEETWHQETQRQVMQVTEALQIKQQELSKTQKELCKIQENLSKTHHELTKALEDLSRSQKILPQTQDQLSKTQQQLAWAQQELSKTQLELTRVRLELRNIEEECLKLKQENTITHQQLTSIQQEDQQKLTITQQELTTTLLDLNRFQHENTVLLKRLEKIQNEFDLCQSQKNTLNCDLAIANAAVEGKDLLLTQSEDKLIRLQEEKNRLCNQIVHLENQMQLLEFKLTTMNQKEVEQKDWHEKVSTLQHDLSFQQAKTIALKEEQTKAIANAQEKVDHAEKCMKSMQEELQTANLCLFERKRQLELLLQEKNNLQDNNQRLTFELNQLTLQQEQKQMDLKNAMLQLKEDKQLIQQIVCTLAKRMKLQMDMVHILPPEFKNRTGSSSIKNVPDRTINILKRPSTAGTTRLTTMSTIGTPTGINIINNTSTGSGTTMLSVAGTLDDFICRFQTEQSNEWRKMQEKWAILQQEVDDIDWKLVHLRNRLEEMVLEESGSTTTPTTSTTTCGGVLSLELSSVTPGKNHHTFVNVSASPYSDAIKIGKSTLEIANESLKQPISRQNQLLNPSSSRPSTHAQDISDHNDVGNTKEETESFTVALKKEMKTMRESYENKLEELNTEVKKTQKLRMDSTQRLRRELEEEKMKNHQVITQLNEQLSVLEQKIQQLQNKTQQVQDQEMEVLEKYTEAIDDKTRRHVIKELFELIMNSCKDEFALRTARRQERVQKLHAYCGTSSVERK
jgi:chromosome segregation ATPase